MVYTVIATLFRCEGRTERYDGGGHYQYTIGQPALQYLFGSVYKKFIIRMNVRVCEIFNNVQILHRVVTINGVVRKAIVREKVVNITVNCVVKFM